MLHAVDTPSCNYHSPTRTIILISLFRAVQSKLSSCIYYFVCSTMHAKYVHPSLSIFFLFCLHTSAVLCPCSCIMFHIFNIVPTVTLFLVNIEVITLPLVFQVYCKLTQIGPIVQSAAFRLPSSTRSSIFRCEHQQRLETSKPNYHVQRNWKLLNRLFP